MTSIWLSLYAGFAARDPDHPLAVLAVLRPGVRRRARANAPPFVSLARLLIVGIALRLLHRAAGGSAFLADYDTVQYTCSSEPATTSASR